MSLMQSMKLIGISDPEFHRLKDGDRNTKYFHHKASQRKARNWIRGLYDKDGVWREDMQEVEDVTVDFYKNLFDSCNPSSDNIRKVLDHVPHCITEDDNAALMAPFSKEEIFSALQQMHPCKAPGPDGMHAIFYLRFWHIIGDDVTHYVSHVLHGILSP